ncbi:MAG: thioredoxin-dependent thiol peroxidase [Phycisphaerae bacterium]|nr:thioredoxin-dependent thiol peroxidase [Phycisphaerae bacterium]
MLHDTPGEGQLAPAFTGVVADGKAVRLSDYRGKQIVVLYFYPKDDTPGCTTEACGFRDSWSALRDAGVEVLGVSPDSIASHTAFAAKYGLPFTLVADEDHTIAKSYGVWRQKKVSGQEQFGIARTTFIIDKTSRVAKVFENVKADGHSAEVLAWIQENL